MKVDVVPHDPSWKQKYKTEAEKIKKVCGDKILTIEHGGSTSIEGLAAKPVIDIYVGVRKLSDADAMIKDMKELHYEYVTKFEDQMPYRRYFTKDINNQRAFHVHTVEASHTFRRDDLMFKDYIKTHEKDWKDYEKLKIDLAKREWNTGLDYNEAKTDFIKKVKHKALRYFGDLYEETEAKATYLIHAFASPEAQEKAKFKMLHDGMLTAVRIDTFPGFSLNRVVGMNKIDSGFLDKFDDFYNGRTGKYALQIPPKLLNDEKIKLLNSRGFNYGNSWVTFYRDTTPVKTRGTDLEIRQIGKEYSPQFAWMLNEVFAMPHETDDIIAPAVGEKEWVTFMAFDGDKPAGSASICILGETAYFSFANVLPEYRRRGIQNELVSKRIDAARARGVKWIMVDTAEDKPEAPNPSYWNMLRHGFRLLYNRPNYVKIL